MQPFQFRKRWTSGWKEEDVLLGEWPDEAYVDTKVQLIPNLSVAGTGRVRISCANGEALYELLPPVGDLARLRKLKSFRDYTKDA